MLVKRNNQATEYKEVLYWDNGRVKIRVPDGEEIKYYKKELERVNAANAYQAAKDDQLISAQNQTIEDQALELDVRKAALVISENSLKNARNHITGMSK